MTPRDHIAAAAVIIILAAMLIGQCPRLYERLGNRMGIPDPLGSALPGMVLMIPFCALAIVQFFL